MPYFSAILRRAVSRLLPAARHCCFAADAIIDFAARALTRLYARHVIERVIAAERASPCRVAARVSSPLRAISFAAMITLLLFADFFCRYYFVMRTQYVCFHMPPCRHLPLMPLHFYDAADAAADAAAAFADHFSPRR